MSRLTIASPTEDLTTLLAGSLTVTATSGAVTPLQEGHGTGWRTLPDLVVAQIRGCTSVLELPARPPIALADGDALCVRGGLHHRFRIHPGTRGESRWCHLRVRVLGAVDVLALLDPPVVLRGAAAARAGDGAAALAALMGQQGLVATLTRGALAQGIVACVLGAVDPASAALARLQHLQRLAPALSMIVARLGDRSLAPIGLARQVRLSPSRFHACFRAALGLAPATFIRQARLVRAQELLVGTDQRVHEIATACGWGDAFHFSRWFKQVLGCSPQAYRQRARRTAW